MRVYPPFCTVARMIANGLAAFCIMTVMLAILGTFLWFMGLGHIIGFDVVIRAIGTAAITLVCALAIAMIGNDFDTFDA